jgi:uncharacterized protein (TIGR00106 family)
VAEAERVLERAANIKYELTAMGTIVEGDLENLLTLAQKMHRSAFSNEVMRVLTSIKIDERRDKPSGISAKVQAVQKELDKVQDMGRLPG